MNSRVISLPALYEADFEITDLFAMTQKWQKGVVFSRSSARPANGIIFLNGCTGEYTPQGEKPFFAPEKTTLCLPQGSRYQVLNLECSLNQPDAWLVEFNIIQNGTLFTLGEAPFIIENINAALMSEYMSAAVRAYEAPIRSPLAVKAAVYRLLSFLCQASLHSQNERYQPILRGIELMKDRTLMDTPIESIAQMCGVSSGCFRRLFRDYAGQSPMQYRMALRMAMARKLLEDSDMTLDEIAFSLNLDSGAYFCKLFKKHCGLTPGEYRRQRNSSPAES